MKKYFILFMISGMLLVAISGNAQDSVTDRVFTSVYDTYLSNEQVSMDIEIGYYLSGKPVSGIPIEKCRIRKDGRKYYSENGHSRMVSDGNGSALMMDKKSMEAVYMTLGKEDEAPVTTPKMGYADVLKGWSDNKGEIKDKGNGIYEMIPPSGGMLEKLIIALDMEKNTILYMEYIFIRGSEWSIPYDRMRLDYVRTDFGKPSGDWFDLGKYLIINEDGIRMKSPYHNYDLEIYKND